MKLPVIAHSHPTTGELFTQKEWKNEAGETQQNFTIMVKQASFSGFSGIARQSTRVAFITMDSSMKESLAPFITDNSPFPVEGKIVIKETLTPYVKSDGTLQSPKINPTTGEVLTHNGQPIYRNTSFTDNLSEQDVLLSSSSSDEATE